MPSITRKQRQLGQMVTMTFHAPTNEEYNTYTDAVQETLKNEDEAELLAVRVKQFDLWLEKLSGADKADVLDRHKSSAMFQIFERMDLDEKN